MARNPNTIKTNSLKAGDVVLMGTMGKGNKKPVRVVGYFADGVKCDVMPKMKELQAARDTFKVFDITAGEVITLLVPAEGYIFTLDGKGAATRQTFEKYNGPAIPLALPAPAAAEEVTATVEEVAAPVAEVIEEVTAEAAQEKPAKKARRSRKAVAA